jgi:uncharacterized protein (DUF2336 family)
MGFLEKLIPVPYKKLLEAEEQEIARRGSERQRVALAKNERASQEILYYLALHDPSDKVRKAVAANPSTPLQAGTILAKDKAEDVRYILARRLVRILPSLSEEDYSQLYAYAVQALGMLALDEVLKIRKALSETLKDYARTPPSVALQLAKDLEREVSEPVLRFCVALSDDALIEILATHPASWAAESVARRKTLSARVSQAVIETGNGRAGAILLKNEGAEIPLPLLENIIERAREYPEWHKSIAVKKELPPLMARKLAAFVDKTVSKLLSERSDFDRETIKSISEIVQRRMEYQAEWKKEAEKSAPMERARLLHLKNDITEAVVEDAIVMGDHKFVLACLALKANTDIENIQKVFDVRAARGICAICWKCGFSMRLALKLQQGPGRVKISALIYPRFGLDYPFTEEELRWQLGVIGIN